MEIVMRTEVPPLSPFLCSQHSVKDLYNLNIDIVTLELGFFAFYHHYLGKLRKKQNETIGFEEVLN